MKRLIFPVIFLLFAACLAAVRSRVIDEHNEFGGRTEFTAYSTGMRYHNEENVRETTTFYDAAGQVVKVQKFLLNGKMGYEYYEAGQLARIEWELPDGVIESIEYYQGGVITRVEWLNPDKSIRQTVYYTPAGEVDRIERTPAEEGRVVEHYTGKRVASIDLYDTDGNLQYRQFYNETGNLYRREMYQRDGRQEKVFLFNDSGELTSEEWFYRTGKRTVSYYQHNDIAKKEYYSAADQLEKTCFFDKQGNMIRCDRYDADGNVIQTEEFCD